MNMIPKIAWRNIWRSKLRSLVVVGSIVLGIWAMISGTGFMNGFIVSYMANAINHETSNIQVHHPQFKKDLEINYYIDDGLDKAKEMRSWEGVSGVTTRTLVNGMISSPRKAAGVRIQGVDMENEAIVTGLNALVSQGTYFEGINRNPVLIGSKLAEELGTGIKSKVVLTFTDVNGNITAAAFRVSGIIESSSISLSEGSAYVRQDDLNRLLGLSEKVHEIAVLTAEQVDEQSIVTRYQEAYPDDLVETWKEIAPQLAFMQEMYGNMMYVLMSIILIALVFGIVNTMLMAVLERMKELGMLMAVGMTKTRVFMMILIETIYLGMIGSPIGLLIGWLTISHYRETGVDLTEYSKGLEAYGYDSILYPYVSDSVYLSVTIGVFVTAFVGAIYPALKAIRLRPVEALHKI